MQGDRAMRAHPKSGCLVDVDRIVHSRRRPRPARAPARRAVLTDLLACGKYRPFQVGAMRQLDFVIRNLGRTAGRCRTQARRWPPGRPASPACAARSQLSCPRDAADMLRRALPQKRTALHRYAKRAGGRQRGTLPCPALQRPSRSSAPVGGSGRADGLRAWPARPHDSGGEGRQPRARPQRPRLGRPFSCPPPSHAARGAERARLRAQQFPEARPTRAWNRSALVRVLVHGMASSADAGPGCDTGGGPSHVARQRPRRC